MSDDMTILACTPCDEALLAELKRRMPALPDLPKYTGAIVDQCAGCGIDVWVGPRQQLARAVPGNTKVLCLLCAALTQVVAIKSGYDTSVSDLGNPEGDP